MSLTCDVTVARRLRSSEETWSFREIATVHSIDKSTREQNREQNGTKEIPVWLVHSKLACETSKQLNISFIIQVTRHQGGKKAEWVKFGHFHSGVFVFSCQWLNTFIVVCPYSHGLYLQHYYTVITLFWKTPLHCIKVLFIHVAWGEMHLNIWELNSLLSDTICVI